MSDVVLGFDPSKRKLGWGVVHDATGQPVTCGMANLDGSPEDVAEQIAYIDIYLDSLGLRPTFALVEYPFGNVGHGHGIFESGVAVGYLEMAARARWPWLTIDRIGAIHWRPKVGIPTTPKGMNSHARRAWLKDQDVRRATALGFTLPTTGVRVIKPSDDAADGALLAVAGWRMLEAGDAVRVTT